MNKYLYGAYVCFNDRPCDGVKRTFISPDPANQSDLCIIYNWSLGKAVSGIRYANISNAVGTRVINGETIPAPITEEEAEQFNGKEVWYVDPMCPSCTGMAKLDTKNAVHRRNPKVGLFFRSGRALQKNIAATSHEKLLVTFRR